MQALVGLIGDLKAAKAAGKGDAELKTAQYMQRRAQFYLDFVEAENSTGFHAPQEAARILGESLNYARQGQIALRDAELQADGRGGRHSAAAGPAAAGVTGREVSSVISLSPCVPAPSPVPVRALCRLAGSRLAPYL